MQASNQFFSVVRGLATFLVALFVLTACGKDSVPLAPPPMIGSATIGPEGGTVVGPDGVSLVIPEGALNEPVTFRIARNAAGAPQLPEDWPRDIAIYEITPHEQAFAKPVTINFPHQNQAIDDGALVAAASVGGEWAALKGRRTEKFLQIERVSLSYFIFELRRLDCIVIANNPDPYPCTHASVTAEVTSTPASALPDRPDGPILLAEATVNFDINLLAPRDCSVGRLTADRFLYVNGQLSPGQRVLEQSVPMTPRTGVSSNLSGGRVSFNPQVSAADNGLLTYVFVFQCTRAYRGRISRAAGIFPMRVAVPAPPGAPLITQQPASLTVTAGDAATFSVRATAPNALAIDWQRSDDAGTTWTSVGAGTLVADGSDLALTTTQNSDDDARFRANVCNVRGAQRSCLLSSVATLGVTQVLVAPSFTTQPADITVISGQTASFTAVANGAPAPAIAWEVAPANSSTFVTVVGEPSCLTTPAATAGAQTTSTCTIAQTSLAASGQRYRAVATNAAVPGGVNSGEALLTVNPGLFAPSFTQHPQSQSTIEGGSVLFSYTAIGTAPINATWQFNGVDLTASGDFSIFGCSGTATIGNGTLVLANVSRECDESEIRVVLRNGVAPDATSNSAFLTVTRRQGERWSTPGELVGYATGIGLPQAGLNYFAGAALLDNTTLRLLDVPDLAATPAIAGVASMQPVTIGAANSNLRAVLYAVSSSGGGCGDQLRANVIYQDTEMGSFLSPPITLATATGGCILNAAGAQTPRGFEFAVTESNGTLTAGTFLTEYNRNTSSWTRASITNRQALNPPAGCSAPGLADPAQMTSFLDSGIAGNSTPPSRIAALIWSGTGTGNTCAATLSTGGTWTEEIVWNNGGGTDLPEPVIAMDRNGNLLAAGSRRNLSGDRELATAFLSVGNNQWRLEATFPTQAVVLPALVFDASGRATLAYRTEPTQGATFTTVYAAQRTLSGAWQAPERLMFSDGDTRFPRLTVALNGDVLALFSYQATPTSRFQVYAAAWRNGQWGAAEPVQSGLGPEGRFAVGARYFSSTRGGGLTGLRIYWRETDPGDPTRFRVMTSELQ
jgi:hypothetical protein